VDRFPQRLVITVLFHVTASIDEDDPAVRPGPGGKCQIPPDMEKLLGSASRDTITGMVPTLPPTEAPLPRSVSWFAPWWWFRHWTPWKRWTLLVGLLLAGYVEMPVVLDPLISQTSSPLIDAVEPVLRIVCFPIGYAYEHFAVVKRFYDPQLALVEAVFRRFDP
jgi:hypothetical protein